MVGLYAGEESRTRSYRYIAAAAAMGAKFVGHSASAAGGFVDPDVRRDGGSGAVAISSRTASHARKCSGNCPRFCAAISWRETSLKFSLSPFLFFPPEKFRIS